MTKARDLATGIPGGLVLVKTQTIGTAVSSVVVADAFSASYDAYKILISNVDASVNDNYIAIKFNNSTGSTYFYGNTIITPPSTTGVVANTATSNGIYFGLTGTTNNTQAQIEVLNPFNAFWTTTTSTGAGTTQVLFGAGIDKNSTSQTGFSINVISAGTLTGGTISVYGYRK